MSSISGPGGIPPSTSSTSLPTDPTSTQSAGGTSTDPTSTQSAGGTSTDLASSETSDDSDSVNKRHATLDAIKQKVAQTADAHKVADVKISDDFQAKRSTNTFVANKQDNAQIQQQFAQAFNPSIVKLCETTFGARVNPEVALRLANQAKTDPVAQQAIRSVCIAVQEGLQQKQKAAVATATTPAPVSTASASATVATASASLAAGSSGSTAGQVSLPEPALADAPVAKPNSTNSGTASQAASTASPVAGKKDELTSNLPNKPTLSQTPDKGKEQLLAADAKPPSLSSKKEDQKEDQVVDKKIDTTQEGIDKKGVDKDKHDKSAAEKGAPDPDTTKLAAKTSQPKSPVTGSQSAAASTATPATAPKSSGSSGQQDKQEHQDKKSPSTSQGRTSQGSTSQAGAANKTARSSSPPANDSPHVKEAQVSLAKWLKQCQGFDAVEAAMTVLEAAFESFDADLENKEKQLQVADAVNQAFRKQIDEFMGQAAANGANTSGFEFAMYNYSVGWDSKGNAVLQTLPNMMTFTGKNDSHGWPKTSTSAQQEFQDQCGQDGYNEALPTMKSVGSPPNNSIVGQSHYVQATPSNFAQYENMMQSQLKEAREQSEEISSSLSTLMDERKSIIEQLQKILSSQSDSGDQVIAHLAQ